MIMGLCLFCGKEFRKRETKYKFCSLVCSSNFNKNGLIRVVLPDFSSLLAEFVGICLGDGYISKYQTAITLNTNADKKYILYLVDLINKLFPHVKVSIIQKISENATDVRINSKIVADFFRNMGIVPSNKKIPSWIFKKEEYKKACVRGLFDTEGSISFKIYTSNVGKSIYKQLNFRNIDKELMMFVRDTLISLNLKPTMTLKKSLYLSNHTSIDIFRKKIGFSNPLTLPHFCFKLLN
ncbi:hypothetical protein HZA75_03695 [Candidatus Roizmanbacteria bacterium]|nr:hypothetical protein [Candidatus Roizmanbacteria bacterium]